jgi:hypothetical protein
MVKREAQKSKVPIFWKRGSIRVWLIHLHDSTSLPAGSSRHPWFVTLSMGLGYGDMSIWVPGTRKEGCLVLSATRRDR